MSRPAGPVPDRYRAGVPSKREGDVFPRNRSQQMSIGKAWFLFNMLSEAGGRARRALLA